MAIRKDLSLEERVPHQFFLVGGLLTVIFLVTMLAPSSRWLIALTYLFAGACLLIVVSGEPLRAVLRRALVIAVGLMLVTTVLAAIVGRSDFDGIAAIGISLTLVATAIVTFRHILAQKVITMRTIAATLDVYLLVGLAFGFAYQALEQFQDAAALSGSSSGEAADSAYFSFVTITTLGYGDLAPATDLARTLAVIETVTGNILLVVFLARFVGMLGRPLRPRQSDD